ncbi:unnamed protein product [Linum tenue]|uniref:Sulfotransferase n=1 Tax=Linum tenue TaxID=586396 RepID=A0AAV0NQX7_9ROSI|nr:unnamed protein product [Linum tenue]
MVHFGVHGGQEEFEETRHDHVDSLGSRFLCNTCVWAIMRDLEDVNVWVDCIVRYPPKIVVVNRMDEILDWIIDDCISFIDFKNYDRTALFAR